MKHSQTLPAKLSKLSMIVFFFNYLVSIMKYLLLHPVDLFFSCISK